MGKSKINNGKTPKTQVELAKEALERGEVLDMMSMLFDLGIGNHTGVIARVRRKFEEEGKGYDYVRTKYKSLISRKSKRKIRVAYYFLPEFEPKGEIYLRGI